MVLQQLLLEKFLSLSMGDADLPIDIFIKIYGCFSPVQGKFFPCFGIEAIVQLFQFKLVFVKKRWLFIIFPVRYRSVRA